MIGGHERPRADQWPTARRRGRRPRQSAEALLAGTRRREALLGVLHGEHQEPEYAQGVFRCRDPLFHLVRETQAGAP